MDEELFRMAVARLTSRRIPYWVDGGTLLGLVRDGGLIPWDGDFDFGVLAPDVTDADILGAFDSRSFAVHSLLPSRGVHSFHITARGARWRGRIDIPFYERVGNVAVHVSNVRPARLASLILEHVEQFADPEHRSRRPLLRGLHRFCHEGLAPRLPASARQQLQGCFDSLSLRNSAAGKRMYYEVPAKCLQGRATAHFLGVDVSVPLQATEYLARAYGADWQTPKKFVNWYDAATRVEEWTA